MWQSIAWSHHWWKWNHEDDSFGSSIHLPSLNLSAYQLFKGTLQSSDGSRVSWFCQTTDSLEIDWSLDWIRFILGSCHWANLKGREWTNNHPHKGRWIPSGPVYQDATVNLTSSSTHTLKVEASPNSTLNDDLKIFWNLESSESKLKKNPFMKNSYNRYALMAEGMKSAYLGRSIILLSLITLTFVANIFLAFLNNSDTTHNF